MDVAANEVLRTPRGDFEAIIAGPAEGPVVLLLHGFPELNLSWRHQVPALAAAGYRVVAPNQRGYAGSVRGGSYRTGDLAADVVAMLDAIGAERAVVVGHDWGGGIAWTLAHEFADRVTALVAMNCPPPEVLVRHLARDPRQIARSWYMFFFQLPVLPERFVAKHMPGTLVAGSYNRKAWNREVLAPYAEAFATPDDAHGPVSWYRGAFRGAFGGALRRTRLRPIEAPVLVIWGVHDRFLGQDMVSPASLRGSLAFGNAADVVLVEEAGHFVQNEAPDEVNRALVEWLAEHVPGAGEPAS
ncbi:MAG: alpha/beta hydrolase [Candidatus Nanopelagicales bacterium]|nr:alpha/beta hydrolase [Candidatus Nanopelagicales bacterium]MCU0301912.1 alpha/beta hydrolase [Candidatus Nanopelagicales bacterium]